MFDKILVPVDLSDRGHEVLETVARLGAPEADVTLLHVVETIEDVPFDEMEEFYRRLEGRAVEVLDRWAEELSPAGFRVARHVLFGHRLEEILSFAVDQSADLILLRSHTVEPEESGLKGRGWATLSYRVAVLAHCPVLLVK